ncbi:MAG: protein kinase [Solirubrobacteraceae bacterium]
MPVDETLIDQALNALDVERIRDLRAGGQKTVLLVGRDAAELVMKVIALGSSSPDAMSRARREVELLLSLDNAHVVKVASDLVELGSPAVGVAWLEVFLEGEDLSDLVGSPWNWNDVAALAADVGSGLAALHHVKVVHRDLSANNVRRLTNGSFVVMDPGFARHTLRSDLTIGGQPGTPGFLSPDHLQSYSGAPTPASDIFCLGNLMFLALTGSLAVAVGDDLADYIQRLARVDVGDLAALRPDLSSDRVAFVRSCLHAQPARRPRNATRFLEALGKVP